MIEKREREQVFGVAYDSEREEIQIAARNDFYAGYRTMTKSKAMDLVFGSAEPTNIFDTYIAGEALRKLDKLQSGEEVLVVNFLVTLDYDTVQPSKTRVNHFVFIGSNLEKRD